MILKTRIMILIVVLLGSTQSRAEECTAIMSGNWSDPAIWSCGFQPGCGDLVIIPSGLTVNVNVMVDLDEPGCLNPTYIQISGTLQFITGFKINLACGSGVEIMPGGQMLPGGGGGSSNWLEICGETEWRTSDGPQSGYKFYGVPVPLAVEFLSLTVNVVNSIIDVTWIVSGERYNSHFDIEFSADGQKWMMISSVASAGDHFDELRYSHEWTSDLLMGYIRLSVVDLHGVRTLLDTKSFKKEITTINLYPNPVLKGESLTIRSENNAVFKEFRLVNSLGQIVQNRFPSDEVMIVSTVSLTSGTYFLEVFASDGSICRERFIVQ
jgi:hypothetical protein